MGISHVFQQNVAKTMNKCLHSQTKCSWKTMRKTSSEFLQGEETIITFQWFLEDTDILLDVSVWSSAVYFYELCCILTSPQGESKYKQWQIQTAILHTKTSNKRFIIPLNLFQPFSGNLKENYKSNKMSARTVLYNNQLYNIVGYLYSFRSLSVQ